MALPPFSKELQPALKGQTRATKKSTPQAAKPEQFLCVGDSDGYSGNVAETIEEAFSSYCDQSGNAEDEDTAERVTFYRVAFVGVNIIPTGVRFEIQ